MFKKQIKLNKVEQAQNIAYKAVDIFKKALLDLEKSNEMLEEVILEDEHEIFTRQANIAVAKDSISSNKMVINKMKDFMPVK